MLYPVISFFLLIVPFFFWNGFGDGIRYPKEALCVAAFISIIGVAVYNHTLKAFKQGWLLLFLLWAFASTLITSYPVPIFIENGVISLQSNLIAWKELFYIALIVMVIYVISSVKDEDKAYKLGNININIGKFDLKTMSKVIVITLLLMCSYAVIQAMGFDDLFRCADPSTGWVASNPLSQDKKIVGDISRRTVGTIGNPSFFGCWIAMCLPFCLYVKRKLGFITLFLALIVLIITKSSLGLLGVLTSVLTYLFFTKRKYFYMLAVILLITLSFNFNNLKNNSYFNPTGRIEAHKEAWNMLKERPLFGLGLGTFEYMVGTNPKIVNKLNNENWRELHDEYGQIWWSLGFIGLMLFLGIIISNAAEFLRNKNRESIILLSSISAMLVMSLGLHLFRVPPTSFYAVVLTGLFFKTIGEKI